MLSNPPLVIDNTVITRFGLVKRFDILKSLYGGNCITPTEVITEALNHSGLKNEISAALQDGWLTEHTISFNTYPVQLALFARLRRRFDFGESAVLAVAEDLNATVASDDMRACKKYCDSQGIPLLGSLGILHTAFCEKVITTKEADSIISNLLHKHKQRIPVSSFQQVRDWFEHTKGIRLF